MSGKVHIIGAGLAGLAAALRLVEAGREVVLYEAGPQAGGRCRSYFDAELGCRIDNGNHLLLSANRTALAFLERIGGTDSMVVPKMPRFDFCDFGDDSRWVLSPGKSRMPWWIFDAARRVPGTKAGDYLRLAGLARASRTDTIAERLDTKSLLFRRLVEPFAVAVLNTAVGEASARLLWDLLNESFGSGGAALIPLVPRAGLSESLIDPALRLLDVHGATVRFSARLRAITFGAGIASALDFEGEQVPVDDDDRVILAVPAPVAARLLPGVTTPTEFRAILNAHYRVETDPQMPPFIGIIGGTAEWVFRKPGILSVTVSAADRMIDRPAEELAPLLWRDVARAYGLGAVPLPAWRIIKEKRATFAATPDQLRRRPAARTAWRNLFLAGDWTATGLPATIEGALRSGETAASLVDTRNGRSSIARSLNVKQRRRKVA